MNNKKIEKLNTSIIDANRYDYDKNKERLEQYVEKDEIYQNYKQDKLENLSDFDKFCIQHCKDIEELIEENQELKEEINKISKKELKVRDMLYSIENGTLTRERLMQIEEVLFELEVKNEI